MLNPTTGVVERGEGDGGRGGGTTGSTADDWFEERRTNGDNESC